MHADRRIEKFHTVVSLIGRIQLVVRISEIVTRSSRGMNRFAILALRPRMLCQRFYHEFSRFFFRKN